MAWGESSGRFCWDGGFIELFWLLDRLSMGCHQSA
jgi:hypothetical protein